MKVHELISELQNMNDFIEVVIQYNDGRYAQTITQVSDRGTLALIQVTSGIDLSEHMAL